MNASTTDEDMHRERSISSPQTQATVDAPSGERVSGREERGERSRLVKFIQNLALQALETANLVRETHRKQV
jgi:hypothetical protein